MKKNILNTIILILLVLSLSIVLVGCKEAEENKDKTNSNSSSSETTTSDTTDSETTNSDTTDSDTTSSDSTSDTSDSDPGVADTTAPSDPSIIINDGDESTASTSVTLDLSAADDVGVVAYYVSESSSEVQSTDSAWISVTSMVKYSENIPFTLTEGDGLKQVYAWYKDSAGNISTYASDKISLSTYK